MRLRGSARARQSQGGGGAAAVNGRSAASPTNCAGDDKRPLDVVFLHLDLGIGGAEQLVVNAAVALQRLGYRVRILTSHHDPGHCFAETRGDGPLAPCVQVLGDWLPRHLLGRCTALCAVLRMLYLALALSLQPATDVVFCDGVSAMVPLLRLRCLPVLFYCHFPDKLLCTDRRSWLKRLYRWPLDWLEEFTTGAATVVAVNSRFTAQVFREAFARIALQHPDPAVIYPAINLDSFVPPKFEEEGGNNKRGAGRGKGKGGKHAAFGPVVSLNRFERKKNIALALEAFALVRQQLLLGTGDDQAAARAMRLVVAGGYDAAVRENVDYLAELQALARSLGLSPSPGDDDYRGEEEEEEGKLVSFRPSISDEERAALLQDALCVLYTPDREHFGIVPLEAMYAGSPVVAVASGGPLETVKDGETGFLRPGTPEGFAEAISAMVREPGLKETMGWAGHAHVKGRFGLDAFSATLEGAVRQTVAAGGGEQAKVRGRGRILLLLLLVWLVVIVGASAAVALLVWVVGGGLGKKL